MFKVNDTLKRGILEAVTYSALFGASILSDNIFLQIIKKPLEKIDYPDGRYFLTKLILRIKHRYPYLSSNCKKKIAENFFINYMLMQKDKRERFFKKYGFPAPDLFVISPTMRCNLKCIGCYSANYNKKDVLDFDTIDRIFTEAENIGIYFVVVSGGEPFIRDDLLDLFAKHNDIYFQVYTNGTFLSDPNLVKELSKLGNVFPCISVEGFEKETNVRRGDGVFGKIMAAMANLRNYGVPFGFSATVTKYNNELLVSEEFIDFYEKQGCILGWYFNYIPVGRDPDTSLMPTPEQRYYRFRKLRELRKKYDIALADFWNDGPASGGCLAGGRAYFHINAEGGVEPCVFAQYYVDNVLNKSLLDIITSDFFREIRRRQAENTNLLTPCMIIDNPQILRDVVKKFDAKPSQKGGEATVTTLSKDLDKYSENYHKIIDPVWQKEFVEKYEAYRNLLELRKKQGYLS